MRPSLFVKQIKLRSITFINFQVGLLNVRGDEKQPVISTLFNNRIHFTRSKDD